MISRRTMLSTLAGGAAACALPRGAAAQSPARLLTVTRRTIEVKGRAASVYGLTGGDGKPGLRFLLGEHFGVRLSNATDTETLIHWHGLTPPQDQDGVPMISQPPLKPGGSFDYDFINTRSGTHWMHSHLGLQEQQMLAAPLIIQETKEPVFDDQEHVVIVHDFTFRDPAEILTELQKGGGAHAGHMSMGGGATSGMDHSTMGHDMAGAVAGGGMLNDVLFDAYLANDRTLADPETVTVDKGGAVRLRIINAAAASNMWIDLGGAEGELIAVDGNAIYPVTGSLFPLAIAQRADIRIRMPSGGGVIPVLFRPEGIAARTGIVLASPGARITKIAEEGGVTPAVDLTQELIYRSVAKIRQEPVTRTEMLMLTGGDNYQWGFNGKPSMHDTLFTVRPGERVAVMMHNMTGMAHPMHLHGHYFKVVAINNQVFDGALRDVVLVPPMQTVTIAFDADNPGTWAFHCHHAYHMNAGMMGTMGYMSAA